MKFSEFAIVSPTVTLGDADEYPYVGMADVTPGQRYVRESRKREYNSGTKFEPGDVLFARITPCLENGKIAQFDGNEKGFGSTEFFVFRARPGVSDDSYLYYLSRTRGIRKPAERSMSGASGRQRADLSVVKNIEVDPPPLPIQRRIAEVLSAYDDLIENNKRRIELLEEMAQAVYREWFVEMHFPGHEDTSMRETDALGPVPEGWEVVTVPEAIEVNPRIPIPDGEKHYVPMAGVPENSMIVRHTEMRDTRRGRKFQNYDTLFARITPSLENGKTGYVQFMPSDDDVGVGSTEFINLRSKTLCPEYVYLLARTEPFRQNAIKSMTGASGRQRVQLECFDDFHIAQPDEETLARFEHAVRPMFEIVQTLVERNDTLRRTRDLLLPRLVSGEVGVDKVDSFLA